MGVQPISLQVEARALLLEILQIVALHEQSPGGPIRRRNEPAVIDEFEQSIHRDAEPTGGFPQRDRRFLDGSHW
jgi:hypothetical protein